MKIKYFLLPMLLLGQLSCNDALQIFPPDGVVREEFWKTKEDVQSVIMGAYESFAQMNGMLFMYGEIRADMVIGDYNQSWSERRVAESNIYPENWLCDWSDFYKVINYCNEVIKNAPLVQENDDTFTD